jgi:hypothetical protein
VFLAQIYYILKTCKNFLLFSNIFLIFIPEGFLKSTGINTGVPVHGTVVTYRYSIFETLINLDFYIQ